MIARPRFFRRMICLGLFLLPLSAHALDGKWSLASNGNWEDDSKWDGANVAGGDGAIADFSFSGSGSFTVTLSAPRTIGHFMSSNRIINLQGAGILTLDGGADRASFDVRGVNISVGLAGSGGFDFFSRSGNSILSGNNTYSGLTHVRAGVLRVGNDNALGSYSGANDHTVGAAGTAVALLDGVHIRHEALRISGNGADANSGALYAVGGGRAIWGGTVYLDGTTTGFGPTDNRIGAENANAELVISGAIADGAGKDVQITGLGIVTLSGVSTYTGTTTIYRGTLRLDGGDNRLPTGTILELGRTGNAATFDLNGRNQQIAGIANVGGAGAKLVTNSSTTQSVLTIAGESTGTALTYSGNLSIVKRGTGAVLIGAGSSYTGDTFVKEGTLTLAGLILHDESNVSIDTGAILNFSVSGTDTIAALFFNGVAQEIGTYGREGSGAMFEVDYITGNGVLNVTAIPEPRLLGLTGVGLLIWAFTRRRSGLLS